MPEAKNFWRGSSQPTSKLNVHELVEHTTHTRTDGDLVGVREREKWGREELDKGGG